MTAEPTPEALTYAFACALLTMAACGEPERNGPAPIGMSAGSVTLGGVTASGSATAPADTDGSTGDGTAGTASTVSGASMPEPTDSSSITDPTLTDSTLTDSTDPTLTDPTLTDPTLTDPTLTDSGDGVCEVGEACEADGLCMNQNGPDGPIAVCSHGFSGDACELDIHCQSMECVTRVGEGGATSYCA